MTGDSAVDRMLDQQDRAADPVAEARKRVEDLREAAASYWRMQTEAVERFGADDDIPHWLGMVAARHETKAARAELRALEAESETIPFHKGEL